MRWAAVMVAIVVSGVVALFAIYTFRPKGEDSKIAAARAVLAARMLNRCGGDCEVTEVRRIAGPVWHVRIEESCYRIDTERFRLTTHAGWAPDECDEP